MKIDHVALYTNNLEKIKEFYVEHFGGGARLEIMQAKEFICMLK